MDIYVVERFLIGWSAAEVDAMIRTINEMDGQLADHGVRHLETIHIPGDETCLSLFVGPDAAAVRSANDGRSLPSGRVLEAVAHGGWS